MPFSPESGPLAKLNEAAARRRKILDKLAGSRWAWAAAAVMALEGSAGCAPLARGACYAALEPNCSGIKYDVSLSQGAPGQMPSAQGFGGDAFAADPSRDMAANQPLGATIEAYPTVSLPRIHLLPEGFYSPEMAKAVREGKTPPPGFIDLRDLRFRSGGDTFAVAHEKVAESPEANVSLAMERAGRHGIKRDPRLARAEDLRRLRGALDLGASGEKQIAAKRESAMQATLARSLAHLAPHLGYDQGVTAEWHAIPHPDAPGSSLVSCRATASLQEAYLRGDSPVVRGQALERDILVGNLDLSDGAVRFSPEKSLDFPERPAQAAALVLADLPPEFFELKAELDAAVWKQNENIRNRGSDSEYQRLAQDITRLERKLADHKPIIQSLKLAGMNQLSDKLRSMIPSGGQMRFFVRLDAAHLQLRVIAVLDDPCLPPPANP